MKYLFLLMIFLLGFGSCATKTFQYRKYDNQKSNPKKIINLKNWQHKDIIEDSIPGISLDKAYQEFLKNKKGDTIIVAVLDTGIDMYHQEFRNTIWINTKEIPKNGIDDDANGYIDDVNGWNFLGNKKGENVEFANYECVRIIRKYGQLFKNRQEDEIPLVQKQAFKQYIKALAHYEIKLEKAKSENKFYSPAPKRYEDAIEALKEYFPNKNITIQKLDSIQTDDKLLKKHIRNLRYCLEYDISYEDLLNYKKSAENALEYYLAENDYDERKIIGDDPENIDDKGYGNNDITGHADTRHHSTKVSGVLAANRNNDIGIKGVTNLVKIMPVVIAASGSEHDKDIALGIRYAVDNGAKVINMSFGNEFSLHREWVDDAIKYAESKDVLIVTTAGNFSTNIDEIHNNYPNDQFENGDNFVNNFIVVGGSSYTLNENLAGYFSSYGKSNVDIFAPGHNIYTTYNNNEYTFSVGTSMACPLVSGIAALIRSYYPNLTAAEVKQIIMESGVSYDIMVNKPSESEEKELVPFSSLSKSGKIVNAYNALLMAEEVSTKKKKRN